MNYSKLIIDKQNGLLDPNMILVYDKEIGFWINRNLDLTQEERDEIEDQYTILYGVPEGVMDFVEYLISIGIPAECM